MRSVEGGEASLATRLTHRYMNRVLELSLRDTEVRQTFLEVFHMLKPPTVLFTPRVAARVLRGARARPATQQKRPERDKLPEAA